MIFLELFYTFFVIGAFTFGGGYAMLPLISEAVTSKGWIESSTLVNFIAVSESTPGPFAINMATYIGSVMGREYGALGSVFGSFCATLGVVVPSFIIILIVAKCYEKFKSSKIVQSYMTGLRPAVVGLIGSAVLSVMATVFIPNGFSFEIFKDIAFYASAVIFAAASLLYFKKVHPILIILISAVLGIIYGFIFA